MSFEHEKHEGYVKGGGKWQHETVHLVEKSVTKVLTKSCIDIANGIS